MDESFERGSFQISRPCRYLIETMATRGGARPLLAIALHGYGMHPATMLRLTRKMLPDCQVLVSLEGPNSHFLSSVVETAEVGYNWGTRETTDFHIGVHHEMLLTVLPQLQRMHGMGPEHTLLVGFSQPVGLNYRFVATHPGQVRAVAALCGGVPRDWEQGPYADRVDAALFHIATSDDEYYPAEITAKFAERLRGRAPDVELHMLPGKHRFPSAAVDAATPWVSRLFGKSGS
jgi:predicted esterase